MYVYVSACIIMFMGDCLPGKFYAGKSRRLFPVKTQNEIRVMFFDAPLKFAFSFFMLMFIVIITDYNKRVYSFCFVIRF